MIAFHFPPLAGSSGVQRTLRFVQGLPSCGWQPVVLTAHPRAYVETSDDLLAEVPPEVEVRRAFALDAARHLSLMGRYPGLLARPDRWSSWAIGAIPAGLKLIRKHRPDAIWSTYPIASAHLIAHRLHRITGLPLVADFRDPMTHVGYPADPALWRSCRALEGRVVRCASRIVLVTPSALSMYRERYPDVPPERFVLIENGFDEETFADAERVLDTQPLNPGRFTLLHSGIVYPSERDPRALFAALARLQRDGRVDANTLRIRFRSPVHAELLEQLARSTGTRELIEILPGIAYREALQEMLRAEGLLVMQASNCNEQVPAKLYEYLRAQRPILGLADPVGDTARVMRESGVEHIAKLEDSEPVEAALLAFLSRGSTPWVRGNLPSSIAAMSRQCRTRALALSLDQAAAPGPAATFVGGHPC